MSNSQSESDAKNQKAFNQVKNNIKHFCDKQGELLNLSYGEVVNTICLNAPWGTGKTFFVSHLIGQQEEYIQNELKFDKVIFVNAFEVDFISNPLLVLIEEIINKNTNQMKKKQIISRLKELINNTTVSVNLLGVNISKIIDKNKNELLNFKEIKHNISETFQKETLIVIDELDRCKPSFALDLLEVFKHFFSIEKITFLFTCDKEQLANSLKGIYGESYNTTNYLNRFFHYTLELKWDDSAKHEYIYSLFDHRFNEAAIGALIYLWIKYEKISCRDINIICNKLISEELFGNSYISLTPIDVILCFSYHLANSYDKSFSDFGDFKEYIFSIKDEINNSDKYGNDEHDNDSNDDNDIVKKFYNSYFHTNEK